MYLVISWNLLKPQVKNIKMQSNRKEKKKNKQKLSKEANSSRRTYLQLKSYPQIKEQFEDSFFALSDQTNFYSLVNILTLPTVSGFSHGKLHPQFPQIPVKNQNDLISAQNMHIFQREKVLFRCFKKLGGYQLRQSSSPR